MKETCKSYYIGIVNGIVFTFAFLFLLIGMDEEFHFMDNDDNPEKKLTVDMIISDLSMFDEEYIENEYLKRQSPEHILDVLLHRFSMVGTKWEKKWGQLSDMEKVKILLDTLSKNDTTENGNDEIVYRDQAELNEIHGQWYLDYNDSIEKKIPGTNYIDARIQSRAKSRKNSVAEISEGG